MKTEIPFPFKDNPPVGAAITPGNFLIASYAFPVLSISLSLIETVVLSDSTLINFFLIPIVTSSSFVTSSFLMESLAFSWA